MLQDMHLEAISETLPRLECLVLKSSLDYPGYGLDSFDKTVSNEGFKALAKLTSLRELHIEIADSKDIRPPFVASAGPAFLTTLNQLTSLTCHCTMSPGDKAGEDLKRISRMMQLRELDLVGSRYAADYEYYHDRKLPEPPEMRNKYLTPLTSLTNLCKLRLPVYPGWAREGMEHLLQKLPNVRDHNKWFGSGECEVGV